MPRIIYGFVTFSSMRIAMQPPRCLKTRSASVRVQLNVSVVRMAKCTGWGLLLCIFLIVQSILNGGELFSKI